MKESKQKQLDKIKIARPIMVLSCIVVTPVVVGNLLFLLRKEEVLILPDLYIIYIVAGVFVYGLVSGMYLNKILKKREEKLKKEISEGKM